MFSLALSRSVLLLDCDFSFWIQRSPLQTSSSFWLVPFLLWLQHRLEFTKECYSALALVLGSALALALALTIAVLDMFRAFGLQDSAFGLHFPDSECFDLCTCDFLDVRRSGCLHIRNLKVIESLALTYGFRFLDVRTGLLNAFSGFLDFQTVEC